jgi:hypothetical protein
MAKQSKAGSSNPEPIKSNAGKLDAFSKALALFESDPHEYPVNIFNFCDHPLNVDVAGVKHCDILLLPPWIEAGEKGSSGEPTVVAFYTNKDIFDDLGLEDGVYMDLHLQISDRGHVIRRDKAIYSIKFFESDDDDAGMGWATSVNIYNPKNKKWSKIGHESKVGKLLTGNFHYHLKPDNLQLIIGVAGGDHPKMNVTLLPA